MLLERHWTFGQHPRWVYVIKFNSDAEWFVETEDLSVAGLSAALGSVPVPAEGLMQLFSQAQDFGMEYTAEDLLDFAKANAVKLIEEYDNSTAVNIFYLAGQPLWLDAATRQQLRISIEAYQEQGEETITKWFGGQQYTFPTALWLVMLNALEVYAGDALNVTERHKATVSLMESVEEVLAFDITADYPEPLNLTPQWLQQHI